MIIIVVPEPLRETRFPKYDMTSKESILENKTHTCHICE
jgi:hypothetical protein